MFSSSGRKYNASRLVKSRSSFSLVNSKFVIRLSEGSSGRSRGSRGSGSYVIFKKALIWRGGFIWIGK